MAGICGFISKQPVSIQNLLAMHQKIAHRGRDDRGVLGIMNDYSCKRIEINKDDNCINMSSQHEEKYVAGLGFHRNIPDNAWSKSTIHYEIDGKKYYTVFDGILYINDHLTEGLGIERQRDKKLKIDKTFSACSEDKRYDEKNWIDGLLKNTTPEAHFIYPQGKDIFTLTENIVYQNDEPYFSQTVFLSYHIYKSAAENGIFTVLNGSGADAIMSKNHVITLRLLYLDVVGLKFMSFWKKLHLIPNKKEYLIAISKFFFPTIWGKLVTNYSLKCKWMGIVDFSLLGKAEQKSNLPPILKTPFDYMRFRFFESPTQRYLKTADRCAHTFGVEVYFPYLNKDVVNELTLVPPALIFDKEENKQILISGVGDLLPEIILNRQSKGHFTTAEESWFLETNREEFIEFFKKYVPFSKGIIKEKGAIDYLTGMQSGKIPFNTTYRRLICFCVWMKVFDVQISEKP